MTRPTRLPLASLPTPLHRADRLSALLSIELFIKRDDLTGSHLSGNKIRKLDYLLADAVNQGATHVITCGGVQSNHCRATALAAAPLGLSPVLLLRTASGLDDDIADPPSGNILLDMLAGARIVTCTADDYRDRRVALMRGIAERIEATGGRPYVIPEGGSNALGALGYVDAAKEIADQLPGGEPADTVVTAVGSGGTFAGLSLGFKSLGAATRVCGIPVCDDGPTFSAIALAIGADAAKSYGLPALQAGDFDLIDGFQGRGYALSSAGELALLRDTARRDGLVLDPVYTVKAFRGLLATVRDTPQRLGKRVVFVHTGGVFGLYGKAAELAEVL